MVNAQDLTPQTITLVNEATGRIYRYKEITVAANHSCVLTYTPVDSSIRDGDIRLFFDSLPEVVDVIRELEGMMDSNLIVAAIVQLKESSFDEEQECEGCPACEELTPENFEEHCQIFATDIHEVIEKGLKTDNIDEALQLADSMFEALPSAVRVRVVEISRERALENIREALSGKGI